MTKTFEAWMEELDRIASAPPFNLPAYGSGCGVGSWRCYYDDGYTPEQALREDLSYAD